MGFQNSVRQVVVVPALSSPGGGAQPLDVVQYGGLLSAGGDLGAQGVPVTILAAPSSSLTVYRLHLLVANQSSRFYLIDDSKTYPIGYMGGGTPSTTPVNGQLVGGNLRIQRDDASAGGSVYVTYDLVTLPAIQ